MRRIFLAFPLIWAVALSGTTAHATTARSLGPAQLTRAGAVSIAQSQGHASRVSMIRDLRALSVYHPGSIGSRTSMLPSRPVRPMSTPHSATLAPVNTSGSDLALPADVLSAGNGTQAAVGSGQGPFSVLHSSWAGYQSGVAAAFNFEPIIDLYYQGSVFSGSASAAAYMSDSLHYLAGGNSVPPTDCSSSIGYPCEIVGYTTTDNLLAVYGVAQVNYCTIETGYQGDPDLIQQNLDTVSKTEAAIFVQGVTEAEAACAASSPPPTQTPVHFTVAARWEKPHLTPSLHGAALKKSKVNKTVQEDSYVMVNSAPASAPAEIQYQVTLGSKKVNGLDETHNLASSDPTGWYSLPHQYKPKKAGTYTLNVRVDIGGTIETGSARLKVTK